MVRAAALKTGEALKFGTPGTPVKFPNTVFAATEAAVNVSAGDVVGLDPREAVNNGDKLPVVKLVKPGDILTQVPSFFRKPTHAPPPKRGIMSVYAANRDVVGVNPNISPVPDDGNFAVVPANVSMIVRSPFTTVPQFCDP